MAAAVAGRSTVYFTFGDTQLRDNISMMYTHLIQHDIDIGINFIYLNNKIQT
jgi:poly(ADP-ribose) glycohydrolase